MSSPVRRRGVAVLAAVLVLRFVAEVSAAAPRGFLAQRRGVRMPTRPTVIDSSPQIEMLNKALKALEATDLDYDGHREKAIKHVYLAIGHLQTPGAQPKSNGGAAAAKAAAGTSANAKTAKTSPEVSDENLRKAKTLLFSAHHKLADHAATKGHLRADAQVRIAISEIVAALPPPPSAKPKASATATATAPATAPAASKTR